MNNDELFICECRSPEHMIVMSYSDDELDDVYCYVHICPERNIFKRIWNALRYIFGHRSNLGDFDEFIFQSNDADKLQRVVDHLRLVEKNKESR